MSLAIINNVCSSDEYTMDNQSHVLDARRRQIIKRKVLAIGKMSKNYALLREHPELVKQLKSLSGNGKLPAGSLSNGEQGIKQAITCINQKKNTDD
ncbi:hypothetical protein BDB01DRAFT_901330 [Pilobolus umbonatus]|nr:hypothetical protein BDB01DRAFT_901330 [Pilobolus umbonatus]